MIVLLCRREYPFEGESAICLYHEATTKNVGNIGNIVWSLHSKLFASQAFEYCHIFNATFYSYLIVRLKVMIQEHLRACCVVESPLFSSHSSFTGCVTIRCM